MSANDSAWENVFQELGVMEQLRDLPYLTIDSSYLNKYRESRLMAKIDSFEDLPEIFQKNGLSILAVSRGSYVIGFFNNFHFFPEYSIYDLNTEFVNSNVYQSLSVDLVNSETRLMNLLVASGIFQHFAGEEIVQTINGRMTTETFKAHVPSHFQDIEFIFNKPQIEIDAGFEGRENIYIVELKNVVSNSFNLRQLYYPMRHLHSHVTKPVRLLFVDSDEITVRIQEVQFADQERMLCSVIRTAFYKLPNIRTTTESVESNMSKIVAPNIILEPFPQADDFNKVIALVDVLSGREMTIEEIAEEFEFTNRQADYYFNAAKVLGLVQTFKSESGKQIRMQTKLGGDISRMSSSKRDSFYVSRLTEIQPISKILEEWKITGEKPSKSQAVSILEEHFSAKSLSKSTLERRATTILSRSRWCAARS